MVVPETLITLAGALIALGISSVKVVSAQERLIVYRYGRFKSILGPGRHLSIVGLERAVKLRIGDVVAMSGPKSGVFRGLVVPIDPPCLCHAGQIAVVQGFTAAAVTVATDMEPRAAAPGLLARYISNARKNPSDAIPEMLVLSLAMSVVGYLGLSVGAALFPHSNLLGGFFIFALLLWPGVLLFALTVLAWLVVVVLELTSRGRNRGGAS